MDMRARARMRPARRRVRDDDVDRVARLHCGECLVGTVVDVGAVLLAQLLQPLLRRAAERA
eukprot:3537708-Pleurochrysis_carterae.AAC.1